MKLSSHDFFYELFHTKSYGQLCPNNCVNVHAMHRMYRCKCYVIM